MEVKKKMKNQKQTPFSWYFLFGMLAVYVILFFTNQHLFWSSLQFFYKILIMIIPIFVLVFLIMVFVDYYITPEFVKRHLNGHGIKKWVYVIVGGILSAGPIYMWYPLLKDLRNKGLSNGLIACFLYNRSIKIYLLPVALFYFGWIYVLVLTIVMVFASILQAVFIDELMVVKQ